VAGLVAAVAAGAEIVPRRILTGIAGLASDLDVAGGLLENTDADIINCSFSGPALDDAIPLAVERALERLSPSTVVVACAGNNGSPRPQWPAASKRVSAVGAVQRGGAGGQFDQPDFTNFGGWVDCCAPGVDVPSTFLRGIESFEGFASWTGTSMACPQVAGAIAATATRHEVDVTTAAYRLVHDPKRPRLPGLGAIVDPDDLP
jgi:subtilisin family serine protease